MSGRPSGTDGSFGKLESVLRELSEVVVAFSGGADSAFLAAFATRTLGRDHVLCVTAISPSLGDGEEAHCRSLAEAWELEWRSVSTAEMDDPAYVANGPDRCAHCKNALMDALVPLAQARGATVVLGVNTDDLGEYRPGQRAAAEAGARFPLVEAGFSKGDVRQRSLELGLSTWDRPAAACLASRLPYGTPVTVGVLRSVSVAESGLHSLGFRQVRVRHHGTVARVEVSEEELERALDARDAVVSAVKAAGYSFVALDLEGFHSGSLNRLLERSGATS